MTNDVEMTMWSHALFNILHVPMNNKQLRKKIACSSLNESIWLTNPEILEQRKHGLHSSKQHSIRCVWRNNSSLGKTNLYKKKSNLNIYIYVCMYLFYRGYNSLSELLDAWWSQPYSCTLSLDESTRLISKIPKKKR